MGLRGLILRSPIGSGAAQVVTKSGHLSMNPPQNAPKWSGGITRSVPREEGGVGLTHLSPPRFFFH
jgi:hypothetical protein